MRKSSRGKYAMRKSSRGKYANQQRRQSSRLSGRNLLCEEQDGKIIHFCLQQQADDISICKENKHVDAVGDNDSDDLTIIDITLKDLQQKCKVKGKKGLRPASFSLGHSSRSDSDHSLIHHDHVNVKEEEPDLEEPLVTLKRKITKASAKEREHRKRAHVDPLVAKNDDKLVFTPSRCNLQEGFPPITTDSASTYHELSEYCAPVEPKNLQDCYHMETVNSFVCSVAGKRSLSSDIPELSYHIKSEVVEAYSLNQHTKNNSTFGLNLGINSYSKLGGNSLSEHIHEFSKDWPERQEKSFISFDDFCHCTSAMKEASMLSISELKNGSHFDSHFTKTVLSELSVETSPQDNASPNVDFAEGFIAKLYHSEKAMTDLHYTADADLLGNEELSSTPNTTPFYHVDCDSTEREELNESLPTIDVNALEVDKIALPMSREESSQLPASMNDTFNHSSASTTVMYPDADKCGSNKSHGVPLEESAHESRVNDMELHGDSSHKKITSVSSCTINMTTGGFRDMALQGVAKSSQRSEIDSNCNPPCEEVYGLEEIFLSSKDNDASEIITCCSNEFSNFPDAIGLREKSEVQPPTISSSCVIVPSDDQCNDRNSEKAIEDSCLFPEVKLNNTLDQLVCNEKLYLVNSLGKREDEGDQGLMECHSPKKLLSNRQTISPSSQERLCLALNGIYECSGSQITGQSEAGYLLTPKKINKKQRNDSEGTPSPVKKVNLRSSDASCRLPCSYSKNSTLTMHMEKAILFAQRQMHDIEKLSTQLLNGLSSMRNILEETVNSDVYHFMASKFTADEIRAANENAVELERTTKKWLTIMTKDCNRFCKIMKAEENKSVVPVNGACRQRRKITFADEVGGVLCQVKVFERRQSAVITPESQPRLAS